jgi:glutaredoxin
MSGWNILTKPNCPSCVKAKAKLAQRGESFSVVEHDTAEKISAFIAAGHRTFPRVFKDGKLIGGFEDLERFLEEADF